LEIVPRYLGHRVAAPEDAPIQHVFKVVAADPTRTAHVADAATAAFAAGGNVLVLTERTEHLDALRHALDGRVSPLLVLHGRMSAKQRTALLQELEALPADAPRVLLSTGKLVGEGFDHAPLDTLILAMPISWKGTLAQYAGRLHRAHASKSSVRIIDFVDEGHPALLRMWERRQRGYQAMGYRLVPEA
jgi:superfamily II DNA or RNA helicase